MTSPLPQLRVSLVALGLVVSGCGDSSSGDEAAQPKATQTTEASAISISTTAAQRKSVRQALTATGAVYPAKTADIGPRVDGIIDQVLVQVGDRVEAGTPLFRTHQANYRSRFDELKNASALAEAEAENAARELARAQSLKTEGVVSQNRLDDIETRSRVANAKLGMSKAAAARASQDLADTVVTAPFRGTITKRSADEGVFMSSRTVGQASGGSVVQLQKIDVVVVVVLVPEVNIRDVSFGASAEITIDGIQKKLSSNVAVINDRIDPDTRSVDVRFYVENQDYAIKPGLFARAEIAPMPREVLALDRTAMLGVRGSQYVFVANGGHAKRVPIDARDLDIQFVEIVSGLNEGEIVLIGPNLGRIYDGAAVRTGAP